ncbi:MAG: amino acid ABC transporter permease [Lachnospiraceae bacterium]|nr:amino acid ABC transporter permease [Lachnospiraceae bacterium]
MNFSNMLEQISSGMMQTILIFAITLLFSLPLGWIVAFGRMSKNKILSGITGFFISILRGTPLMLQLMVVFYGPFYLAGVSIGNWRFPAIIVGFSINYAAYFAEIYRSGINAIPVGQYEAAHILGYNKVQTFFKIILPQVIRIILPAVTNEVITLVKDTSLAFSISYMEMFAVTKQIAAANTTLMPFAIAGFFYYVFNLLVSFVMRKLEKRLNYY